MKKITKLTHLSITDTVLDNLPFPIVIGKAVFDGAGSIEDIAVVYVNQMHREITSDFLKVGDTYKSLQRSLPADVDWYKLCTDTLRSGTKSELDYFSTRIHKWFHLIAQKCENDYCGITIVDVTDKRNAVNQYPLSARQLLIAQYVIKNMQYKEISNTLLLSVALVKKECKALFCITGTQDKKSFILKFKGESGAV